MEGKTQIKLVLFLCTLILVGNVARGFVQAAPQIPSEGQNLLLVDGPNDPPATKLPHPCTLAAVVCEGEWTTMPDLIRLKAKQYGVNPERMLRIAKCESSLNPKAKNPKSSATGLLQFTKGTWQDGIRWRGLDWTLEDRLDPEKSADMAAWFMARGEWERWECK